MFQSIFTKSTLKFRINNSFNIKRTAEIKKIINRSVGIFFAYCYVMQNKREVEVSEKF